MLQTIRNVYFSSINPHSAFLMGVFSVVCRFFQNLPIALHSHILRVLPGSSRTGPAFTSGAVSPGPTSSHFTHFRRLGYFDPFSHSSRGARSMRSEGQPHFLCCLSTIGSASVKLLTGSWLTKTLGKADKVIIWGVASGIFGASVSLPVNWKSHCLLDAVSVMRTCVKALCELCSLQEPTC